MNRVLAIAALLAVQAMAATAALAQRVTWHEHDGGNGHAYEIVRRTLSWQAARDEAVRSGGHLVTINFEAENRFVLRMITHNGRPRPDLFAPGADGRRFGPWIGAEQAADARRSDEGWAWVTGESFAYSAWAEGEPSDYGGQSERVVHYFSRSPDATPAWNDTVYVTPSIRAFIVEYESDAKSVATAPPDDAKPPVPVTPPPAARGSTETTVVTGGSWMGVMLSMLVAAFGAALMLIGGAALVFTTLRRKSAHHKIH